METLITEGIKVSVESYYEREKSIPDQKQFIHSYFVTIENNSNYTIKLVKRSWLIVDANGRKREVHGEGVIGSQPIIKPGQFYEYSSWCPLETNIGKMSGSYTMLREIDERLIEVKIPEFRLIAKFINN